MSTKQLKENKGAQLHLLSDSVRQELAHGFRVPSKEIPLAKMGRRRKGDAEQMYQAMMNIFEDLSIERSASGDTQKAVMNILEDLQDEITAKNRFLAILSHELRNPLAPITSNLEYIKLHGVENKEVRESIDTIEHQFSILTRLLKDLLDVARISSNRMQLNFEKVELQTVLNHAVASAKLSRGQTQHAFSISLPEAPVTVVADPLRLEQVILNLLSNAIKYTPAGGSIWLKAQVSGNKEVRIAIRDTGKGINREVIPRLFNLFIQEEDSATRFGGGMGVGLALVRSLVELHGGSVHASSEGPGRGSTFTVQLPFVPPSSAVRI